MAWPTGVFDPPWNERGGGKIKRGADRHYPLLKTKEMPAVIRGSGVFDPAEDAHMWMWVTNNKLRDGLWLMEELGFTYQTNVVWIKLRDGAKVHKDVRIAILDGKDLGEVMMIALAKGMGRYIRGGHELLLFGTRGRGFAVRTENNFVPSVIFAPRGRHSEKPEAAKMLIRDRSKGPYMEFFSRAEEGETSTDWNHWGPMVGHAVLIRVEGVVRAGAQSMSEARAWVAASGHDPATCEIVPQ